MKRSLLVYSVLAFAGANLTIPIPVRQTERLIEQVSLTVADNQRLARAERLRKAKSRAPGR